MADWSNPSPFQHEALHEALLFVYPTPLDLNMILQFGFGQSYATRAPNGEPYDTVRLSILIKARGAGWLKTLVQKARQGQAAKPEASRSRPQL